MKTYELKVNIMEGKEKKQIGTVELDEGENMAEWLQIYGEADCCKYIKSAHRVFAAQDYKSKYLAKDSNSEKAQLKALREAVLQDKEILEMLKQRGFTVK